MAKTNQSYRSDDFKLAVVIRIEGRNCRAIIMRGVGILAALFAAAIKVAILLIRWSHH